MNKENKMYEKKETKIKIKNIFFFKDAFASSQVQKCRCKKKITTDVENEMPHASAHEKAAEIANRLKTEMGEYANGEWVWRGESVDGDGECGESRGIIGSWGQTARHAHRGHPSRSYSTRRQEVRHSLDGC